MKAFNEKVNEIMNVLNLKQRVIKLQHVRSRERFNTIDDLFMVVFNKTRSTIEGPIQSVPFSQ